LRAGTQSIFVPDTRQPLAIGHALPPRAQPGTTVAEERPFSRADVHNCWIIFNQLLRLMFPEGPLTWEGIWHASEQARIPKVMTFGKHKGAAIADIPADYKRWLLGQQDVDPYLVKALRGVAA
jgi:hypothetical protein